MIRRTSLPLLRRLVALVALAAGLAAVPAGGRTQELVADLSDHLIAISTDFTGTEVVLFGALDGEGEIAVVVRGPAQNLVVRQKDRVAGIWVNRTSMTFAGAPSFYGVATSEPLVLLADDPTLERHGIGLRHLRLDPVDAEDATAAEIATFRRALIRAKQISGLYATDIGDVSFLGGRLFRTRLAFPANVPTGQYIVSVYLIRDGVVVNAQTTPLVVSKIGLGAEIFAYAQRRSAAYGLVAILVAVTAGWLASVFFRQN